MSRTVQQLQRGSMGFIDPFHLVEQRATPGDNPPTEAQMIGLEPVPPFDPHTGAYLVCNAAVVVDEPDAQHSVPIRREPSNVLVVDFMATSELTRLGSPPRFEWGVGIEGHTMCLVSNLDEALGRVPARL